MKTETINQKKILYFIFGLDLGGAEAFIYNVLSKIDTEVYHIDFVLQKKTNTNIKLLDLCERKNCKIFVITPFYKNPMKSKKELITIIDNNDYSIIHYHANALINTIPVEAALKKNISLIIHSHNTSSKKGLLGNSIHKINRFRYKNKDIIRLACSQSAGEWMYGNDVFTVIDNGINLDDFKYDRKTDIALRNRYGIKDEIVLGHIGRFEEQKNHIFLIDIFAQFHQLHKHSKLVLVGNGSLVDEMKKKVQDLKLDDAVIFAGPQQDTSNLYNMFDCFVFPSKYEGLPFSLLEAEAIGMPIVSSDVVPEEMNVTGNINFMSLSNSPKEWAEKILSLVEAEDYLSYDSRKAAYDKMVSSKYNVENTVKELEKIYDGK